MVRPNSNSAAAEPRLSVQYSFDATPIDVRASLKTLEGQLNACGLSRDSRSGILLALGEVLNNVVEHAYAGCGNGAIQLDLSVMNRSVSIQIKDFGIALPGGVVPDSAIPDMNVPLEDLPEGGFGWAILQQLASEICYYRLGDENILYFEVPTVMS